MRLISKDQVDNVLQTPTGEVIYELIGRAEETGGTAGHSLAHVTLPPGKSSEAHYHRESEETYYVLQGRGWMEIDGDEFPLEPGQALLIEPGEVHKISNHGESDLEFLAVCSPPWVAEDSFSVA